MNRQARVTPAIATVVRLISANPKARRSLIISQSGFKSKCGNQNYVCFLSKYLHICRPKELVYSVSSISFTNPSQKKYGWLKDMKLYMLLGFEKGVGLGHTS